MLIKISHSDGTELTEGERRITPLPRPRHGDGIYLLTGRRLSCSELARSSGEILPKKDQFMSAKQKSDEIVEVLFSYSRKDERLKERLENYLVALQHKAIITRLHDRMINPCEE